MAYYFKSNSEPLIAVSKTGNFSNSLDYEILFWSRSKVTTHHPNHINLYDYLEANQLTLKKKLLSFVFDLSQKEIEGVNITDYLRIDDSWSYWWMTKLNELNTHSEDDSWVYDLLRIMCVEDIIETDAYHSAYIQGLAGNVTTEIKKLLESKNIVVNESRSLKLPSFKHKVFIPSIIFQIAISITFYLYYVFSILPFRKMKNGEWGRTEDLIFIDYSDNIFKDELSNYEFKSKYWHDLPDLVSKYSGFKFLHIFARDSNINSSKKAINYFNKVNKNHDSAKHIFLESFINVKVFIMCFRQWISIISRGKKICSCFSKLDSVY